MKKISILILDNHPSDINRIEGYLKQGYGNNCSIIKAATIEAALETLDNRVFSVVLLDASFLKTKSKGSIKKLREASHPAPIIILNEVEDKDHGKNALRLGVQDFLVKKELTSLSLKRTINYCIERAELSKELNEKSIIIQQQRKWLLYEQEKLSLAQKMGHIGNWEFNIIKNKFFWSKEFYRVHSIPPLEDAPSLDNLIKQIHPQDQGEAKKEIENTIKFYIPINIYYRIIDADKRVRIINFCGEVKRSVTGKPLLIYGTGQDVTQRFNEKKLEKLAMAATKSCNSVVIMDPNGMVEWVNEGFTNLTGYSLEDIKNTDGRILRRDQESEKDRCDFMNELKKNKTPVSYECKNYSKEGNQYWVIATLSPVFDESGELKRIIAIDSDITSRKKAEEELLIANKIAEHSLRKGGKAIDKLMQVKLQLEETMKFKDQFLATMSHEIRTPMNAIVGFTNLALKLEVNAELKENLEAIKASGNSLLVIINDILDFSKLRSGKTVFEKIEFSFPEFFNRVILLMTPKAEIKGLCISCHADDKIPQHLIGDPTRLSQILVNLIGNAIKFTKTGEIKVEAKMISEKGELVELEFSIEDNGIGIPEEKQHLIFDGFSQASIDTTRKYGGTGLGLAISKSLVEGQGGEIKVTSKEEVGTRFTFILMFKKCKTPIVSPAKQQEMDNNERLEGVKVLLVEDNLLNQVLARKILCNWNWEVELAGDGKIAIEKLEKKRFDIILMDIQLPEMNGYETTKFVRTKLPPPISRIPIIAMTAHAIIGESKKCTEAEMNDYISKPFDEEELYAKVIALLDKNSFTKKSNQRLNNENKRQDKEKITDLSYLNKIAYGDNKFIVEILETFIDQIPDAVKKIEESIPLKEWKTIRAIAHKIKPSFTFVGVKKIDAVISNVEEFAGKEINLEQLPELVSIIRVVCDQAVDELKIECKRYSK